MFKKIGMILIVLVSFCPAFAASQDQISFQGKLEMEGTSQTAVDLTFRLYNVESGGPVRWQETHTGVAIGPSGIFNVLLGSITSFESTWPSGVFFQFSNTGLWLEVLAGSTTLGPRRPFTSAPYAYVARNLKGGKVNAVSDSPTAAIVANNTGGGNATESTASIAGKAGVKGKNDIAGGFGVIGESLSGTGVYGVGVASGAIGVTGISALGVGVFGFSASGVGVRAMSSTENAIYATAEGISRAAIYGENKNYHGVHGRSNKLHVAGVFGENPLGYGVWGRASGAQAAVMGENLGTSHGVYGSTANNNSAGVYGNNTANSVGSSIPSPGVYGKSTNGSGIYGFGGATGQGVYGRSNDGVGVKAYTQQGSGVHATATYASGNAIFTENTAGGPALTIGQGGIKFAEGEMIVDSDKDTISTDGSWVTVTKPVGTVVIAPLTSLNDFYIYYQKLTADSQIFVTIEWVKNDSGSTPTTYSSYRPTIVRDAVNHRIYVYLSGTVNSPRVYNLHYWVIN